MSGVALVNISNECGGAKVSTFIQASRDYFIGSTPKPGYTPYRYPHPLISGGQTESPPPAPQNLRVTSLSVGNLLPRIEGDKIDGGLLASRLLGAEDDFFRGVPYQILPISYNQVEMGSGNNF